MSKDGKLLPLNYSSYDIYQTYVQNLKAFLKTNNVGTHYFLRVSEKKLDFSPSPSF